MRESLPSRPRPQLQWPWQIRADEWKRVVRSVLKEASEDNLSMAAAALAFYAMLALFPGLIALVSLYGLVSNPVTVEQRVSEVSGILPESAREVLSAELHSLVTTPSSSLSIGLLVSTLAALWSASSGVESLIDAINLAYDAREQRSFLRRRLGSLLITLGLVAFVALAIALVAVLPSIVELAGWRSLLLRVLDIARWPTLAVAVMVGLMLLYRYGPCRKRSARWASSGPIVGTLLWLGASSAFSLYVSEFGSYNKTYGALGGVIVLLLWFYLSAYIVLLGAELSAELEGEKRAGHDRASSLAPLSQSTPQSPSQGPGG